MIKKPPHVDDLPAPPPGTSGWPWTESGPRVPPVRSDGRPWPRVTVVTPSYNQGSYIEETIRSILLQQYPDLEYIVIDAGSADDTLEVIRKYEPWITYWVSEPDHGQAHAINKGLARATGELFNWINSDDVLTPGAVHAVADAFVGCDMVAGGNVLLSEDGAQKPRLARGLTAAGLLRRDPSTEMHQMAMWVRRDEAVACGGMDEEMHYAFDPDFFVRYLHAYPKVRYLDVMLGWFRKHEDAKTVASRERFLPERMRTIEKIRTDPGLEGLRGAADYAERKYEWWLRLAEIVNTPDRGTRTRAAQVLLSSNADRAVRWDRVTRRAVKELLKGRELRPFTPVI